MYMKQLKRVTIVMIVSVLLAVLAALNLKFNFIAIPASDDMVGRQIDFITISTVFVGFSFTALGLLLGLSSEKLIERVKNTNIILGKVDRIINSIVFFMLSVIVSLYFVMGLNDSLIKGVVVSDGANNVVYILGIGYLITGIIYFVYSVYELYDLIKQIYSFNRNNNEKQIEKAKEEFEKNFESLRNADFDKE